MKNLLISLFLLILSINIAIPVAYGHSSDNFCSFYRKTNDIQFLPYYEAHGLIGGAVLAYTPGGKAVFVDMNSPGDAEIVLDENGNPAIEHCELYQPYLCHDDVDFVLALKDYWHNRRELLDNIHNSMEARARSFTYAHLRGDNNGNRPLVASVDFPIPHDYDTSFRDYWNRIIRSPETVACANWREGIWSKDTTISYLNAHSEAALAHLVSAREVEYNMFVSEFYIQAFSPDWCTDPRGNAKTLADKRTNAWFFSRSVTNPIDLLNIE